MTGGGLKYLQEYRDPEAARRCAEALARTVTRPWVLMEVCGGQTHALIRHGVDRLLPEQVTLVHGPGCPVCVTPVEILDQAMALAARPEVILCTFADMLRVPGSSSTLAQVKAAGGDVRPVYSPLDALAVARAHPGREVVFLGVGFETTAPVNALAVAQARQQGLAGFSLLAAHVLVPPAVEALLSDPANRVQGFLAAGHVCAVVGTGEYEPLARRFGVPFVVTGFEPLDLLQGILMLCRQLEEGRAEVENQYARAVSLEGNRRAQALVAEVFEVAPQRWRGLGEIPRSGLRLRPAFAAHDAALRFGLEGKVGEEAGECRAGEVLRGLLRPPECPAFGTRCTPERPLGAPMVSDEGACAAYHRYRREEAAPCRG